MTIHPHPRWCDPRSCDPGCDTPHADGPVHTSTPHSLHAARYTWSGVLHRSDYRNCGPDHPLFVITLIDREFKTENITFDGPWEDLPRLAHLLLALYETGQPAMVTAA